MSRHYENKKRLRHSRNRGEKYDSHHPYPNSRTKKGDFGKFEELLCSLELNTLKKKHRAWHQLFLNFFPEEVILAIKKAFRAGKKTPPEIISFIKTTLGHSQTPIEATKADLEAWSKIFGARQNPDKIKKIIFENWTYPDVRTIITNGKITSVLVFLPRIPKDLEISVIVSKKSAHLKISEKIKT